MFSSTVVSICWVCFPCWVPWGYCYVVLRSVVKSDAKSLNLTVTKIEWLSHCVFSGSSCGVYLNVYQSCYFILSSCLALCRMTNLKKKSLTKWEKNRHDYCSVYLNIPFYRPDCLGESIRQSKIHSNYFLNLMCWVNLLLLEQYVVICGKLWSELEVFNEYLCFYIAITWKNVNK